MIKLFKFIIGLFFRKKYNDSKKEYNDNDLRMLLETRKIFESHERSF